MSTKSSVITSLENTPLWKAFAAEANDEQRHMVRDLVQKASDRLDLVRDTFPTYTLHNYIHALNVVNLMGDLLGSSVENISALEGAILILSAFFHDIGMVFTEKERQNLSQEEDFEKFLKEYPEAYVSIQKDGKIKLKVAEWYCRWIHPKRVHLYLNTLKNQENISWEGIPFELYLGYVYESHGQDTSELYNGNLYINYLEEADLLFCSIILRLADILDFDNTRSPDEVYKYLDLPRRDSPRKKISDIEWLKHLSSGGFSFPNDSTNRGIGYKLGFKAAPNHPAVEYDIKEFLKVIETEMSNCQDLLRYCSYNWQSFKLPGSINRDNIHSQGYRYGEYRFTLEQNQVLKLFMGEDLYQDRYVFVRELLQNAIDTSRHREYYERMQGKENFKAQPICITQWRDNKGRLWIRFDDYGMGMDDSIIREHFLRVGSSYYRSDKFFAEIIKARNERCDSTNFVPISRFGIGLLSCFIIGDRVEVSTRHLSSGNQSSAPIRLSLNGIQGFYILQTGDPKINTPEPMPSVRDMELGSSVEDMEPGYRKSKEFGTSIAVRLDPCKEQTNFDLSSLMRKYVFSSPIPVRLQIPDKLIKDELVGCEYETMIENPWCQRTSIELSSEEMDQLNALTGYKFSEPLSIEFVPIDLTNNSSKPEEFKGQLLTAIIQPTEEWGQFVEILKAPIKAYISLRPRNWNSFERGYTLPDGEHFLYFSISTQSYTDKNSFISTARESFRNHNIENKGVSQALEFLLQGIESAERVNSNSKDHTKSFSKFYEEKRSYKDSPDSFSCKAFCYICIDRIIEELPETAKNNISAIYGHSGGLISHNGVVIPPKYYFSRIDGTKSAYPLNLKINLYGPFGSSYMSWGSISLADSLRPHVDISREALRTVPLEVYSHALLSLHKALKNVKLEEFGKGALSRFTHLIRKEPPTLKQLEEKTDILNNEDWLEFPLLGTYRGDRYRELLSINEILQLLETQEEVEFGSGNYLRSFARICALALAQHKLKLQVRLNENNRGKLDGELYAVAGEAQPILEGQKFFPPYTFLPYVDCKFFVLERFGVNLNHRLSEWIIQITPDLDKTYPGIFNQFKLKLVEIYWRGFIRDEHEFPFSDVSGSQVKEEINDILKGMRNLKKFRPEESLFLTDSDFLEAEE